MFRNLNSISIVSGELLGTNITVGPMTQDTGSPVHHKLGTSSRMTIMSSDQLLRTVAVGDIATVSL